MHPAVKFFQRFPSSLIADVISSLVWTLAGDHQCASKLPEKCAPLCEELVEAKEVHNTHVISWHDYGRCLFAGLIVGAPFARLFLWLVPSLRVFVQQQCRWNGSRTVLIGYAGEGVVA